MNVVIVDDHPLVRQGLYAVLSAENDIRITGEASGVPEATELILNLEPDIALIDLRLADHSGLEIVKKCKAKNSPSKYIILTSSVEHEDFRQAGEVGVDGYILKDAFPEELLTAVRLVYKGRKYYDPSLLEFVLKREEDRSYQQLTQREREVLGALGEGLCNKEIANKLYISEYTVKKHVSQILSKLELADRTQAALYARERQERLR
ncbi:MAG TPA: response regulator transcription factor [Peptococcaceae bacterium]|nr:response regulator transcription factor [Peptococcaceae bacterium]